MKIMLFLKFACDVNKATSLWLLQESDLGEQTKQVYHAHSSGSYFNIIQSILGLISFINDYTSYTQMQVTIYTYEEKCRVMSRGLNKQKHTHYCVLKPTLPDYGYSNHSRNNTTRE